MTVAAILQKRSGAVLTVEPGTRVREAVAMLAERRIGALPVTDGGKVIGIVSERDVIYRMAAEGADMLDGSVESIMSSPAITVEPTHSVLAALSMMTNRRIRHLPVVHGGGLVGIVSIGDLVKHRLDQIESEAEAMRAYIQTA
jgi:CBS domain-containing protein